MSLKRIASALALTAALGCQGVIGGRSEYEDPELGSPGSRVPPGENPLEHAAGLGFIPARRLTQTELTRTLAETLGVDARPHLTNLPEDPRNPFDNDSANQLVSAALIEGTESFARAVVADIDDASLRALVGCAPTSATDVECLREFIARVGPSLLRRPLTPEDVDDFAGLIEHAEIRDDFWVAPRLVLSGMIQDLEFMYRIEIGEPTPEPGIRRLTPYELASRLSFLIWGSGPDAALLADAASGRLASPADRRITAARMLEDPRASAQMGNIHAMWLGYDQNEVADAIAEDFRVESDALVQRVLFGEDALPWTTLFTSDETFVTPALAAHYGMAPVSEPSWVAYDDAERRGILSHASWLSLRPKQGDSSPTVRGRLVLERMFCREVPLPTGAIDTDEVPEGEPDACKPERYSMTRDPACQTCHLAMDPLGFGLERFGPMGLERDVEDGRADCAVEGVGALPDGESYSGPAELGAYLVMSGEVQRCFTEHLFRYAVGRSVQSDDRFAVDALSTQFVEHGDLLTLILDLVGSESFAHRVEDGT